MMALVWLIDILVIGVKILGGRMKVNPVLRLGLWLSVLTGLAVGVAALGFGVVELERYLTDLA